MSRRYYAPSIVLVFWIKFVRRTITWWYGRVWIQKKKKKMPIKCSSLNSKIGSIDLTWPWLNWWQDDIREKGNASIDENAYDKHMIGWMLIASLRPKLSNRAFVLSFSSKLLCFIFGSFLKKKKKLRMLNAIATIAHCIN